MGLDDRHHPSLQHADSLQDNSDIDLLLHLIVALFIPLHHLKLQATPEETAHSVP